MDRVGTAQLGPAGLGTARLGSAALGSAPLSSAGLGLAQLGLGPARRPPASPAATCALVWPRRRGSGPAGGRRRRRKGREGRPRSGVLGPAAGPVAVSRQPAGTDRARRCPRGQPPERAGMASVGTPVKRALAFPAASSVLLVPIRESSYPPVPARHSRCSFGRTRASPGASPSLPVPVHPSPTGTHPIFFCFLCGLLPSALPCDSSHGKVLGVSASAHSQVLALA